MQLNQFASTSNQTQHASTCAFSDTHKKLTQRVLGGSLVMGAVGSIIEQQKNMH